MLRKTHISPQKLNDFARLLRRLHVEDALIQCEVSPKKAARICRKVGRSRMWPRCPEHCLGVIWPGTGRSSRAGLMHQCSMVLAG